jgi:hypothetical protein
VAQVHPGAPWGRGRGRGRGRREESMRDTGEMGSCARRINEHHKNTNIIINIDHQLQKQKKKKKQKKKIKQT